MRSLTIACVSTAIFALALALAAPARQITGDAVPNRYGAALVRCGGGFDLSRVDWIAAQHEVPYWAHRNRAGATVSVFGPAPAMIGAIALADFGDGDTIDDATLRARERLAAAVLVAIAAGLVVLA
ncbi:MAG: hypothetical protein M3619_18615, partial [Myxococcota bacterium]|nr:hypothetical protein [Myxococcota bacterium]